MPSHKYKVGQEVDFTPGRWGPRASPREYMILRVLPFEGGDLLYRIKCATETFERVAKESELAARAGLL